MDDAVEGRDASGNKRLTDVGPCLLDWIRGQFKSIGVELTLKYIIPSYAIRSVPADPHHRVYCVRLAHNTVHSAMSGLTEMLIGVGRAA